MGISGGAQVQGFMLRCEGSVTGGRYGGVGGKALQADNKAG